jgi:hypothetical protein
MVHTAGIRLLHAVVQATRQQQAVPASAARPSTSSLPASLPNSWRQKAAAGLDLRGPAAKGTSHNCIREQQQRKGMYVHMHACSLASPHDSSAGLLLHQMHRLQRGCMQQAPASALNSSSHHQRDSPSMKRTTCTADTE